MTRAVRSNRYIEIKVIACEISAGPAFPRCNNERRLPVALHRNRELRAIRESHQDFFPELGVFINRQFGNELADNFWKFKFWI